MKILHSISYIFIAIVLSNISHAAHGNGAASSAQSSTTCSNVNKLPKLDCASAPDAVFADNGRLWIAWSYAGHVYVSYSDDKGRSYSKAVTVNLAAEEISARGENRPKIALNNKGGIYVSWTTPLEKRFSGNVRFSYSNNNGRSFSKPITVNDNLDITGHRFDALTVADNGNIYLAWLDKRDKLKALREGKKYTGAAVYYAMSDDGGKSFHANKKIIDNSCECCRVVIDTDNRDLPVIFWRNIYDKNTRDHALVNFDSVDKPAEPVRMSYDNWQVDACPHHGPDMSITQSGNTHLVWFNNAEKKHGLFYKRLNNDSSSSEIFSFGNYDAAASHPNVLSIGNRVWLSWKEFDGKQETAWVQFSENNGDSWSDAKMIASTLNGSDYPFLLNDKKTVYLQWKTTQEGFQLLLVDETKGL